MAAPPFTITQDIRDTFRGGIDALITQLGQPCLMTLDGTRLPCPNCGFDAVQSRSSGVYNGSGPLPFAYAPCPYCRGTGYDPATLTRTEVRTFGVRRNLKASAFYPVGYLTRPVTVASIKGFVDDLPVVQQAKTFVLDYQNAAYTGERYYKISEPLFTGNIVPGRYWVCYLQREE